MVVHIAAILILKFDATKI